MNIPFNTVEFMSDAPITFTPETGIFEAIHVLLQYKISGATVLDENNEVVGVISELDCLKAIINQAYYREGAGGKVKDFMTSGELDYMDPNASIVDAAEAMLSKRRRRMPLMKDGKFSGQISARSILQAFKDTIMEHDKTEDERAASA